MATSADYPIVFRSIICNWSLMKEATMWAMKSGVLYGTTTREREAKTVVWVKQSKFRPPGVLSVAYRCSPKFVAIQSKRAHCLGSCKRKEEVWMV